MFELVLIMGINQHSVLSWFMFQIYKMTKVLSALSVMKKIR